MDDKITEMRKSNANAVSWMTHEGWGRMQVPPVQAHLYGTICSFKEYVQKHIILPDYQDVDLHTEILSHEIRLRFSTILRQ